MAGQTGICKISGCERPDMGNGYCRLHYITYWRQIKARDKLADVVLKNRVREAMIRDDVEGKSRKRLNALKRAESLSDVNLEAIISEIRQNNSTHR